MLTSWSPENVTRLKVSTPMKPWTTVPLGAFGVMVSVMVPWTGRARCSAVSRARSR